MTNVSDVSIIQQNGHFGKLSPSKISGCLAHAPCGENRAMKVARDLICILEYATGPNQVVKYGKARTTYFKSISRNRSFRQGLHRKRGDFQSKSHGIEHSHHCKRLKHRWKEAFLTAAAIRSPV